MRTKLSRNPFLKTQYSVFLKEYIDLGHMSLAPQQDHHTQFFLPHHCVQKLDSSSPKLRIVFDGSAKSTSGQSLNNLLLTGPTIQPKIFHPLICFRLYRFALCGDICKMYRCVQCILWRNSPEEEIDVYKSVTYEAKPAAFLAIRAMH